MKLKFSFVYLVICTAHIICDGKTDCKNGKNVESCNGSMKSPPKTVSLSHPPNVALCPKGTFMCKNQICIPETWRCDGTIDCVDNSDEIGCPGNSTTIPLPLAFSCQDNEFKCSPNFCISGSLVCDLKDDCAGGEDEFNCTNNLCLHYEFLCGPPNYNCINSSLVCDGVSDCNDGKDEKHCNGAMTPPPTAFPSNVALCPKGTFMCKNQICIPETWRCDGNVDCVDNSDEIGCPDNSTTILPLAFFCQGNEFKCSSNFCIPRSRVCDLKDDCEGGEDELNCANNACLNYEFSCGPPNYNCINFSRVCDGVSDCKNRKDEQNCNRTMTPSPTPTNKGTLCPKRTFMCKNQICIPETWRCDGTVDCVDNSDEIGCPHNFSVTPSYSTVFPPPSSCQDNEFKCLSNFCIPRSLVCDLKDDCEKGEDELNCAYNVCLHNEFSCGPPSYKCINSSWVCDGVSDCTNEKDEKNCNVTMTPPPTTVNSTLFTNGTLCPKRMFTCRNQICIPERLKCDNTDDCGDKSDEIGCPHNSSVTPNQSTVFPPPFSCQDNEFKCLSNFCIPRSRVCDLKDDCEGGEDELNCANNVCLDYEFSCGTSNYNCINSLWVCDGVADCKNGKDEQNCNGTTPLNLTPSDKGKLCPMRMFTCRNQVCVPERWKCDNTDDCGDNSDEIGCSHNSTVTSSQSTALHPLFSCQENEFKCLSNFCIPRSRVCDRNHDCSDGDDELNCAKNVCLHNEFFCGPPNYNCIDSFLVCNGESDCNNGKDEQNCIE